MANTDPILTSESSEGRGFWNKGALQIDGALSLPIDDNAYTNPDLRKEGQIMYDTTDEVIKYNDGEDWINVISEKEISFLDTISELELYSGISKTLIVNDNLRGGIFNYVESGLTPDSGIVFNATGIGSGYWQRQYDDSIVNASWFGVIGDNTTINTPFFQNLFTSIYAMYTKIVLPKGFILIDDEITIPFACEIVGLSGMRRPDTGYDDGVLYVLKGNSNIVQTEQNTGAFIVNVNGVGFRDLSIINNNENVSISGAGIRFNDGARARLENMSVTNFNINVDFDAGYYWSIDHCELAGATQANLRIANTLYPDAGDMAISNSWFVGGHVEDMVDILYNSAGGLRLINSKFQNNVEDFRKKGCIQADFTDNTILMFIENCSFEGFKEFGIRVKGESGVKFNHVHIHNSSIDPIYDDVAPSCIDLQGDAVQKINLVSITDNILQIRNTNGVAIKATNVNMGEMQNLINSPFSVANHYVFTSVTSIMSKFPASVYMNRDYMTNQVAGTSTSSILAVDSNNMVVKYPYTSWIWNQSAAIQTGDYNISGTARANKLGIGSGVPTGTNAYNSANITGATVAHAEYINAVIQPDVTSQGYGKYIRVGTAAGTTIGSIYALRIGKGTLGAGSAITNISGVNIEDLSDPLATNVYGVFSNIGAGTNRYCIYTGTAQSFFGGNVGIATLSPTARLHINIGTATLAPLKFTSGTLLTTPEVGAVEHVTDKLYFTINTGAARKELTLNDVVLNNGIVPITTVSGRLTNSAVTGTELGYLSGSTSAIQTQINAKAPLASPALTGIPTVPTAPTLTSTTQAASTEFVYNVLNGAGFATEAHVAAEILAAARSTVNTTFSTAQSASDLNTAYPSIGFPYFVVAPNVGTGMVYIKYAASSWMAYSGTLVV